MPVGRADLLLASAPLLLAVVAASALAASGRVVDGSHLLDRDALLRGAEVPIYQTQDNSPFLIWAPSHHFVCQSLSRGALPLWNPAQGGGSSPLAKSYGGVLFPLRWLSCLWPPAAARSAYLLLGAALALSAAFLSLRALGAGRGGAGRGGGVFGLTPPIASFHWYDGAAVFAFAPVFAALGAARPTRVRVAAFAAVTGLAILAGHPLLVMSAFLAGALIHRRAWPFLAAIPGVFLVAFALLPFAADLAAGVSYKSAGGARFVPYSWPSWAMRLSTVLFARRFDAVDA
ncbi:MAG: hypothetical protein FJ090_22815, partial [Deltaproteobacteria bacterium]|nr:hypothetical protein [Deltaproteobacteria bacterium]